MIDKKIAVALEHRFYRHGETVYTKLSFPYEYWKDYLTYFDDVTVVARVKNIETVTAEYKQSSGPNVKFFDLPYYIGPRQMIIALPKLIFRVHKAVALNDKFLLRSGNVTNFLWLFILLYKRKYLREYPGNIRLGVKGVAGSNIVTETLSMFLDGLARLQGRFSQANSFVSDYCKKLYGSSKPGYVFSSFQSDEIDVRKTSYHVSDDLKVISVGRLEGEKGHLDLIKAISIIRDQNVPVTLHLVGAGRQAARLEEAVEKYKINCVFYGAISDRKVLFDLLKRSDVYVIPSLTEGMPRALLEAMAVGLPCIGTSVGGIPEVLSQQALVAPAMPKCLANKIREFYSSLDLRRDQGQRNASLIYSRYDRGATERKKHEFWSKIYE